MTMPPRFPVSAAQIDAVVATFYARIRKHPVLGPVFFESIPNERDIWIGHEAKIARFWRNAILFERSYDGNPQQVHASRPAVKPEHFEQWLALFDEVLTQELPADLAAGWSALAHRIGAGLRMGVTHARQRDGAVPRFG